MLCTDDSTAHCQAPRTAAGCYSLGPPMYTAEIESDEGRPATVGSPAPPPDSWNM
jgi:hypothetical protein